jgi:hypothetical protein
MAVGAAVLGLRDERSLSGQCDYETALPQLLDGSPGGTHGDLVLGSKVALSRKPGANRQLTSVDPGRNVVRHRGVDVCRADGLRIEPGNLSHKITIGRR